MARSEPNDQSNSSGRARAWNGPGVLTYGYRPFFLMAGVWAALAMTVWIALLTGQVELRTRFDPVSWHAHEMLFGYLGAVMAGFLLTAVPNWTGRLPIVGLPLAALSGLWVCGRVAIAVSEYLPPAVVAGCDLVFPVALTIAIGREILASNNRRNLVILALLTLFIIANGLFHMEAVRGDYAAGSYGFRMGLGVAVMMLSLIGGRIVPSFTRNWLVKQGVEPRLPSVGGRLDKVVLLVTLISLAGWAIRPEHPVVAALCLIAGLAHLIRLSRWRGWLAWSEPLLWILHVGYSFVPLGFLAVALSGWGISASPQIGAQHVWMAGAIGVTTMAVMTRASLGHAGRPLTATPGVTLVYLLIICAVVLRFVAAFGASPAWVLNASSGAWIAGYLGFVVLYWPILTKRRG
ncbi:MAG: NnrS family protein [Rhodobacteraceae bacterium]|nr:NnrS family protein [Paracoccaceae bacterium]